MSTLDVEQRAKIARAIDDLSMAHLSHGERGLPGVRRLVLDKLIDEALAGSPVSPDTPTGYAARNDDGAWTVVRLDDINGNRAGPFKDEQSALAWAAKHNARPDTPTDASVLYEARWKAARAGYVEGRNAATVASVEYPGMEAVIAHAEGFAAEYCRVIDAARQSSPSAVPQTPRAEPGLTGKDT
jgi:hypothetical protein